MSTLVIEGYFVRLERLSATHSSDIIASVCNEDTFARVGFMVEPPPRDPSLQHDWFLKKVAWMGRHYYACITSSDGRARGLLALMRDEPIHRTVEIGDVLFGSGLARTAGATEAVFLLLRHAFETMGYRRVEWKCDTRNIASYRAAERFGFVFEGVFRQHMLIRGESRDSAWFSMLDAEWPARRTVFERWLSPDNFDEQGKQRSSLSR